MSYFIHSGVGRIAAIFFIMLTTHAAAAQEQSPLDITCTALMEQPLPNGKIISAKYVVPATGNNALPEHCKVIGKLNERVGIDGMQYAIGFELSLPANWNQRFYFQGGGGTDGILRPAVGSMLSGGLSPNALFHGFAVVATDSGHLNQPGIEGSYLFGADPQARIDYGYNHLPVVTSAAKLLIKRVYGQAPHHSYFVGCSNGGRQGMMATQRFPDLFDGVLAVAPAYRVIEASLDAVSQTQLYAAIAPSSAQDSTDNNQPTRPVLGNAFSPAELTIISKGILKACDALDGASDGMVNNIQQCRFDPVVLRCTSKNSSECLPTNKITALKRAFDGARTGRGKLIYSAWPYDPGIASPLWTLWKFGPANAMPPQALNTTLIPGAMSHLFFTPPKMISDLYGFTLNLNLDEALPLTENTSVPFKESGKHIVNADSTDITAFKKRGGKLMLSHGMADGIFSPHDTVKYFLALQTRYGKRSDKFARLYLIPGMAHCGGGPATDQFDAVSALVAWVEEGTAPGTLMAKAGPMTPWPERTRPLCAYPKQAMYSGKGSIEEAANFICR